MRVDLLRWRVEVERVCVAAFAFEWQARDYVARCAPHFQRMDNQYGS